MDLNHDISRIRTTFCQLNYDPKTMDRGGYDPPIFDCKSKVFPIKLTAHNLKKNNSVLEVH